MEEKSSIDVDELAKFSKTDSEWWDLNGEFKLLHQINPVRVNYITEQIIQHFNLKPDEEEPLKNLRLIDIGCGGGITCVPMQKSGAEVTGLDANECNIKAASDYAKRNDLDIDYINDTVENHVRSGKKYNIVLCLEVVEHVANLQEFVQNVANLVEDGGILIFSTINRTVKSYMLAIIMAEYILRWVPQKTHDHAKFVKPSELSNMARDTKLKLSELKGLSFSVISNKWSISEDIDVNYFAVFKNKVINDYAPEIHNLSGLK